MAAFRYFCDNTDKSRGMVVSCHNTTSPASVGSMVLSVNEMIAKRTASHDRLVFSGASRKSKY